MRQFALLYQVFQAACRESSTRPSVGRFLTVMDPQVLEMLSRRFAQWDAEQLLDADIDDLVALAKLIADDEAFPLLCAEDHLEALNRVGDCVAQARLKALGFLQADIEKMKLNQDVLATPTDKAVSALGGATRLRGVTLH
ncbi:hypothetical protein [Burkholderia cenocepacia]|uniref:hypothetical protein n=1 Tax=Burkholderia cenocepacia TaxID=95486 RepID=UPI000760F8D9|nr:hypothetical protein [Burkholderia cenocepacia]KWU24739.1 hypothetical protein AS149_31845 [Burkholderia cenocepacia]